MAVLFGSSCMALVDPKNYAVVSFRCVLVGLKNPRKAHQTHNNSNNSNSHVEKIERQAEGAEGNR